MSKERLGFAAEPTSPLARYRVLSPNAGVHVSPIGLGAMSIGNAWGGMGAMDKESSYKLLDAYFDAGGNFIDTANGYQDGTSEQFIGDWMEERGNRDQMVIATKYTSQWKKWDTNVKQKIHYTGNSAKAMHISVEASLKKLKTDYIDIFYVHWWDWDTSIPEVMTNLHALIMARKVLYLGISDAPAWVVAKANQYARDHALTPFCIYQGQWSLMQRSFERDIIPMARDEGMALAPWDVLAAGKLRSDEQDKARREDAGGRIIAAAGSWERSEDEVKMSQALEKVAGEIGASCVQAVAIAYVMQKAPYVFPMIGGRKIENLQKNMEAIEIVLSDEHIKYLESILPFDVGFPNWMIGNGTGENSLLAMTARFDRWPKTKAIQGAFQPGRA